jgi:hypothetical protein
LKRKYLLLGKEKEELKKDDIKAREISEAATQLVKDNFET